ncbi:MAG: AI-2E family transporter [Tepidisphaeraceae bacterium]
MPDTPMPEAQTSPSPLPEVVVSTASSALPPSADRKPDRRLERTISWAALALLIVGCMVVIWPFMSALLWAAILTFTTWPIYQRLLDRTNGRRTWAALLMTLAISLVLLLPFVVVGVTMADDARALASATKHWFDGGPPAAPAWIARVPLIGSYATDTWNTFTGDGARLLSALKGLAEPAASWLLIAGLALSKGVIELSLSILIAFFLYRDGVGVAGRVSSGVTRLAGERGAHLLELAGNTVRGVVYGILGTAIVQGMMAGVGFLIAGVPGAMVLALLTFLLSIVPMGPPLIWIPVTLWLFSKGAIGWGVFMLIWGLLVSSVDNVVKPWLISKGSAMPFILIFFGVIGGALAFGFIGVFLGPTLLAVGYSVVHEWAAVGAGVMTSETDASTKPSGGSP